MSVARALLAALASALVASSACAPLPAPSPAPASPAPNDPPPPASAADLARPLAGAAAALRTKKGTCPTVDDVRAEYTLPESAFRDRAGVAYSIACTDDATRVFSGVNELVAVGYAPRGPSVPSLAASGAPPPSALEITLARARAGFRRCYAAALAANPNASGRVEGTYDVAADGSVTTVRLAPVGPLAKETVTCMENVVRSLRFEPGAARTVTFGT